MNFLMNKYLKKLNSVADSAKMLKSPWKESPQLSITLYETRDLDDMKREAMPFMPGGPLRGYLDIRCGRSFHVSHTTIFLEGK